MAFYGRGRSRAGGRTWFFAKWAFAKWTVATALALMVGATLPTGARAPLRIADDHGGNIGAYWSRFTAVRDSKEQVIIDGTCSSACTLVLGIVPSSRICVTKNALLGFHAAWRPGFLGFPVINEPATRTLMSFYPAPIRQWIVRNGGLTDRMLYLNGSDLVGLYRECQ
jgi:hypothetical protein